MNRFLTLCLSLIVTFSVSAVAAISIGRGQPASKAVQYWHLADCAPPCWAGITLNSTSMDEAVDRISRLFSDFGVEQTDSTFQNWSNDDGLAGMTTVISLRFTNKLVSEIWMGNYSSSKTMPTLGELIAIFGPPACISFNPLGYFVLFYADIQISATQLSLTTFPRTVGISQSNLNCQDTSMNPVAWRGFRSVELYVTKPSPYVR